MIINRKYIEAGCFGYLNVYPISLMHNYYNVISTCDEGLNSREHLNKIIQNRLHESLTLGE